MIRADYKNLLFLFKYKLLIMFLLKGGDIMLALFFLIVGLALIVPVIVWVIKAGYIVWRVLGIISCVIAIIFLIILMLM